MYKIFLAILELRHLIKDWLAPERYAVCSILDEELMLDDGVDDDDNQEDNTQLNKDDEAVLGE